MTKPKFYRDGVLYVVRDCSGKLHRSESALASGAMYREQQKFWHTRFRVFLVEGYGNGLVAVGYGADPAYVAGRLKGLIVGVGPWESEMCAKRRSARIRNGMWPTEPGWYELTRPFRNRIVNESVGLYGPVTREIRARRRRALARTAA